MPAAPEGPPHLFAVIWPPCSRSSISPSRCGTWTRPAISTCAPSAARWPARRPDFTDIWFYGMQVTLQDRPDEATGLQPGGSRHFGVTLDRADFDAAVARLEAGRRRLGGSRLHRRGRQRDRADQMQDRRPQRQRHRAQDLPRTSRLPSRSTPRTSPPTAEARRPPRPLAPRLQPAPARPSPSASAPARPCRARAALAYGVASRSP